MHGCGKIFCTFKAQCIALFDNKRFGIRIAFFSPLKLLVTFYLVLPQFKGALALYVVVRSVPFVILVSCRIFFNVMHHCVLSLSRSLFRWLKNLN
jgi:hypothetical protein